MRHLTINGHAVAYEDVGQGPPVILAHCSSASHRQWSALTRALQGRYRVLAPDLIGYGESKGYPLGDAYDPLADVQFLSELLKLAGEPVHLVGHSYGGAMALEAARLAPQWVRSLTLIEPVSFHLLILGKREVEWREISAVAERVISGADTGNNRRAASAFMGYWIGRLRWWFMPRRAKTEVIATIGKVAKEFRVLSEVGHSLADYQKLAVPTLLIVGARTRPTTRAVIDVLASTLPLARLTVLDGAGHMSPFTHKEQINVLVQEFIAT